MLKFNCLITGDDYNLLKTDTPESRKKVSALASVIFIPVIIWFANGFLMASNVLQSSVWIAFIVAIILSSLIFLIEKNIIMAHNSRAIKMFRYSLGIVIALLGAVCLDEVIFKQDVDQQLFMMNKATVASNLQLVDDSYKNELDKAEKDVSVKYAVWQQALIDVKREADGSSGSGIKGVHAITRIKLAIAEIGKVDYEKSESSLTALKNKITIDKTDTQKRVNESLKDGALLNRIKALFQLVFSDWYMAIIYLLFTAFLFAMEFLVVFLKSAWPMTNYERRLELIEEIGRKRMEKVSQNDISHFEPGKVYPSYKNAKEQILKNGNISLYN
jgi:hypothetical protein